MMIDPTVRTVLDALAVGGFAVLVVWAAWRDGREFIIPNPICLGIVLLYPLHVLTAPAAPAWPQAVAIAAAVFALGWFCFARDWMGGGDVKLLAGVSLWAGPTLLPGFLLVAALCGGGLSLVLLAAARLRAPATAGDGRLAWRAQRVPYGLAIATGGLWTALQLAPA